MVVAMASTARADDDVMPNFVPTVMDRRWAVSISMGSSMLMLPDPSMTSEAPTWLLGGELAGRFRVRADIEIGPTVAFAFWGRRRAGPEYSSTRGIASSKRCRGIRISCSPSVLHGS